MLDIRLLGVSIFYAVSQLLSVYIESQLLRFAGVCFSFVLFMKLFCSLDNRFLYYHVLLSVGFLIGQWVFIPIQAMFLLFGTDLDIVEYKWVVFGVMSQSLGYKSLLPLLSLYIMSKGYFRRSDIFLVALLFINSFLGTPDPTIVYKFFIASRYPYLMRDFAIVFLLLPYESCLRSFTVILAFDFVLAECQKPIIIGLVGKSKSGKTTLARYISVVHDFEKRAFAKRLKDVCNVAFSIRRDHFEDTHLKDVVHSSGIVPRQLLQSVGNSFREFDKNVWIRSVFDNWYGNNIIVEDCRFKNEAFSIKERGGILIKIQRPKPVEVPEMEIDEIECDYVIENDGTLTEMYKKVNNIFAKF